MHVKLAEAARVELVNEATVFCHGCKNMLNNCWKKGKKKERERGKDYELLLMRLLREKTGN